MANRFWVEKDPRDTNSNYVFIIEVPPEFRQDMEPYLKGRYVDDLLIEGKGSLLYFLHQFSYDERVELKRGDVLDELPEGLTHVRTLAHVHPLFSDEGSDQYIPVNQDGSPISNTSLGGRLVWDLESVAGQDTLYIQGINNLVGEQGRTSGVVEYLCRRFTGEDAQHLSNVEAECLRLGKMVHAYEDLQRANEDDRTGSTSIEPHPQRPELERLEQEASQLLKAGTPEYYAVAGGEYKASQMVSRGNLSGE